MKSSRIKNVLRNTIYSYFNMIASGVFSLLSRWLIVYYFSEKYLGLSGLFSSIFQVLSLAELGFSGSIVYNLYKPLADGDNEKVCAILGFFKKIYFFVGVAILTLGLIIMPFIKYLIKDDIPSEINIYLLYIIFLFNTCVGYFFGAYKISLLDALQRLDVVKKINLIICLVGFFLQILCLITFKNIYIFFLINVFLTLAINISSAYVSKIKFPQFMVYGTLDTDTKKNIFHRVKGLLVSNVSAVTYTTFDSIILSCFLGLDMVAIYSNYLLIFNMLSSIIILFRRSLQSSVGNSIAIESVDKNYNDMLVFQLIFSIIASWCVTCMLNIYQPFMFIWMGKKNMLSIIDVILLCAWFYISVVSHAFYLYLAGNGLWWEIRIPYILSTFTNIIMNIVLGKFLGVTGIIASTLIATLIFGTIWQCFILFKKYFVKKMFEYFRNQLFYLSVCLLICFVTFFICNIIPFELHIFGLIIRFLICSFLSVFVMFVLFNRLKVFKDAKKIYMDNKYLHKYLFRNLGKDSNE